MIVKPGRYGGTYAHKDIAFHFAMWLSPEFQIYLIKEFQRLKEDETNRLKLEWNLKRTLAKVNYRIHTDAIKENLVPKLDKPILHVWDEARISNIESRPVRRRWKQIQISEIQISKHAISQLFIKTETTRCFLP